ncbi:MAG: hypothetical protein JXB00_01535 [Bacteroidales bacterium]|nr:hypothetical protein [Bacteroidales bacterium]
MEYKEAVREKRVFNKDSKKLSVNFNVKEMNYNKLKPDIKNAAFLIQSVEINKPIDSVFNYIIYNLKDNYKAMAEGHIQYELLNAEYLQEGTEIDCREKAGNQTVYHKYRVEKIIPNEYVYYLSLPSKVFIELPYKTIESKSNTYCFYDFEKINDSTTSLQLTIAIQFGSGFEKFYSTLFGGIAPWKKHQKEEMEKLKELIENS